MNLQRHKLDFFRLFLIDVSKLRKKTAILPFHVVYTVALFSHYGTPLHDLLVNSLILMGMSEGVGKGECEVAGRAGITGAGSARKKNVLNQISI